MRKLLASLAFFLPLPANAFELQWPVDCTYGKDCFIQNYVDHDPSLGYQDYHCGKLSYNEHRGTDIRLPNLARMKEGVAVRAAAGGVVKNLRDGEADAGMRSPEDPLIKNKECGNGVLLVHPEGWETQYCHLLKGSIAVKAGENVKAGQTLGKIGFSGMTQFPHVHFEVRRQGKVVDPFTGEKEKPEGCLTSLSPLWDAGLAKQLPYQTSGLLTAGFAPEVPEEKEAAQGKYRSDVFAKDAKLMVLWADLFGVLAGDTVSLRLLGPDGRELVKHQQPYSRNKAQVFLYIGKKLKSAQWEKGRYTGEIAILRGKNKMPVIQEKRSVTVD